MTQSVSSHLAAWISSHFTLAPVRKVHLIRAYTNDVYLVETCKERYVLKVYGSGWRRDSEIRFEVELLDHLDAQGIAVAQAIRGRTGEALQTLMLNGKRRQAILFNYAPGSKPSPPFAPAMYHREGRAVAALHIAADDFATAHDRRSLDLAELIDGPLAFVESLDIDASVTRPIVDFGRLVRARIEALAGAGLDWGVCHGDLTFDNLHIADDGEFVWYDFDSGGYGWRAIDCQEWTALDDQWRPHGQAFLDGYREVRPLSDGHIATAPYLTAATEIWGIQVDLERRVLAKGKAAVQDFLAERADRFTAWRCALHKDLD